MRGPYGEPSGITMREGEVPREDEAVTLRIRIGYSFWYTIYESMSMVDHTYRTASSSGEYNPTSFSDYTKNVSVHLSSKLKPCSSVGGSYGSAASDCWRDSSSDSGEGWMGLKLTLKPGQAEEVDLITAAGWKQGAGDPGSPGIFTGQVLPALRWFFQRSAGNLQSTTKGYWINWLSSGATIDLPDDRYDSVLKRIKLLEMRASRTMNVNEIAAALGVSHPTASMHIRALQEAGLVQSASASTDKGAERRCWTALERIVMELDPQESSSADSVEEVSVPVGLFCASRVVPPCGLLGRRVSLTPGSHPLMAPYRDLGEDLWVSGEWVEYCFPFHIPSAARLAAIEFEGEVCPEAPGCSNKHASDITVWFNGVEVETWTSPGDFGGRRGKLNPAWWPDSSSQFGILKSWKVDASGCYLDSRAIGKVTLDDVALDPDSHFSVRIGVKSDARNQGAPTCS